jgi:uncharacterized membrane protein (DUF373 family)
VVAVAGATTSALDRRAHTGWSQRFGHDQTVSDDNKATGPGSKSRTDDDAAVHARVANRALEVAETVVYVGIAALLTITALALLVLAGRNVGQLFAAEGAAAVALDVLDTLLLVFIVVELLYAVRVTLAKRELLAEPFLLVGIIVAIKEIIVLSVKAAEEVGNGAIFEDQMWEIGVLGVLVLLLGATAWMLRRKEREPDEANAGDDTVTPA